MTCSPHRGTVRRPCPLAAADPPNPQDKSGQFPVRTSGATLRSPAQRPGSSQSSLGQDTCLMGYSGYNGCSCPVPTNLGHAAPRSLFTCRRREIDPRRRRARRRSMSQSACAGRAGRFELSADTRTWWTRRSSGCSARGLWPCIPGTALPSPRAARCPRAQTAYRMRWSSTARWACHPSRTGVVSPSHTGSVGA